MSSSPRRPSSPVSSSDPGLSSPQPQEPEDGEELQDDNLMQQDYRAIPELDNYEADQLDDQEFDDMAIEDRRGAERELKKRDHDNYRQTGRGPAALLTPSSDVEERPRQRRRIEGEDEDDMEEDEVPQTAESEEPDYVNLDDFQGPLWEYLAMEAPRLEVRRRFKAFLAEFQVKGRPHYPALINTMCNQNKQSLHVSYLHLSRAAPILAIWIADAPEKMFELLNLEAMSVVLTLFPHYQEIHTDIHVRITSLPIADTLRSLRQIHLNALIKVEGVVTRRTSVFPQLKNVKYNCLRCSAILGPYVQPPSGEVSPGRCPNCQATGPFTVYIQQTVFQNYQKVTLQESPGSVPAGRVPRQKDIILLTDLVDSISPGEEVEITGVYKHTYDTALNVQHGFPVFSTVIQANYVEKKADNQTSFQLSDDDKREIIKLSKNPNIGDIICRSIGPSIFGHQTIKTAVAMSLFSGVAKEFENKHRIRGDINVLLLGDPGTAKSQFLKYIEKTAHRAVFTTGKGASAVGLTASVRADPLTKEWTLEGGALVLADNGICLIDEFDKMSDQDRTSIHEAMEQQTISISKAGIITTLKARCAVVAAANPVLGRYDSSATFNDNVELTNAIISRFDILCVVRDTVDRDMDIKLASFVVNSHDRAHPNNDGKDPSELPPRPSFIEKKGVTVPQDMLRKYIKYARQNCQPRLTSINTDKIAKLYADLRRESSATDGIPIAVRHMESMIRMSEAHAKMHLRDHVNDEDINMAMSIMLQTFIGTQKFAVRNTLKKHFDKYISYKQDTHELLLHLLNTLVREAEQLRMLQASSAPLSTVEVPLDDFQTRATQHQITRLDNFFASALFSTHGFTVEKRRRLIIKQYQV